MNRIRVYLDGTGVPKWSCLGEIRSDIKTFDLSLFLPWTFSL